MGDKEVQFSLLPKIINGGIAGVIGATCVFPLDLVKTRLQNQQIGPSGERMYTSMFDCFKKTFKAEGFLGMYKGSSIVILLVTPDKAVKLAANDFFRFHLRTADGLLSMPRQMLAGGLAGMFQIVTTTPMELVKIQMQDAGRIASKAKESKTVVPKITARQVTADIIKKHGILGLYKGTWATILRDVPFAVVYFPLFAELNDLGPRKKDGSGEAVFWCSFLAGLGAGSFAALSVTPCDVVKTRIQALKRKEGERAYSGILDAIINIMRYEGPLAFFKGGACRMIVIAPLYGIAQTIYYLGVAEALLGVDR